MQKTKKGYTLIEIMVVMAIIAVLSTLILGAVRLARNTASETTNRSNAKTIQTALEALYARERVYCGGSTGVTCSTVGGSDTQSLQSLATSTSVSLTAACASDAAHNGGGVVHVESDRYYIQPWNYNCSAVLPVAANEIRSGY